MGHNFFKFVFFFKFLFYFFQIFFLCFFDKSDACISFVEPSILIHAI